MRSTLAKIGWGTLISILFFCVLPCVWFTPLLDRSPEWCSFLFAVVCSFLAIDRHEQKNGTVSDTPAAVLCTMITCAISLSSINLWVLGPSGPSDSPRRHAVMVVLCTLVPFAILGGVFRVAHNSAASLFQKLSLRVVRRVLVLLFVVALTLFGLAVRRRFVAPSPDTFLASLPVQTFARSTEEERVALPFFLFGKPVTASCTSSRECRLETPNEQTPTGPPYVFGSFSSPPRVLVIPDSTIRIAPTQYGIDHWRYTILSTNAADTRENLPLHRMAPPYGWIALGLCSALLACIGWLRTKPRSTDDQSWIAATRDQDDTVLLSTGEEVFVPDELRNRAFGNVQVRVEAPEQPPFRSSAILLAIRECPSDAHLLFDGLWWAGASLTCAAPLLTAALHRML